MAPATQSRVKWCEAARTGGGLAVAEGGRGRQARPEVRQLRAQLAAAGRVAAAEQREHEHHHGGAADQREPGAYAHAAPAARRRGRVLRGCQAGRGLGGRRGRLRARPLRSGAGPRCAQDQGRPVRQCRATAALCCAFYVQCCAGGLSDRPVLGLRRGLRRTPSWQQ